MSEEKSDELSLHDTIAEAVKASEEAETTEVEEPSEDAIESVSEEGAEATEEVDAVTNEAEKAEEGASAQDLADEAIAKGIETATEEESDDETLDAPTHWALEDQEMFRAVDGKIQKWLLGRSKDMEAAHTKRSQEIAPLRTAIEEHKPYLDSINVTPELAFKTLISAEQTLRTGTEPQKRAALLKLAHDYGIPLEEPKANGTAQEDFLQADIRKAVEPLQQEVGTLRQTIAQREEAARLAQAEKSAEQVRQFRDAKTEAGDAAHPYFDEVQEDMTRLAQADVASGKTPDINDLYERAIWANSTVRAKVLAAQQHAAKKQEKREQKEKVQKAKKANVSVTGTSSTASEQPKSLRATIEEAAGL